MGSGVLMNATDDPRVRSLRKDAGENRDLGKADHRGTVVD